MENLDTIVVVALTCLGLSLLILTLFLIPLILQLGRLINILENIATEIKKDIVPSVKQVSGLIGDASKIAESGKQIGGKLSDSLNTIKKGIKAGISNYKSNK